MQASVNHPRHSCTADVAVYNRLVAFPTDQDVRRARRRVFWLVVVAVPLGFIAVVLLLSYFFGGAGWIGL